eukprot:COSAG01_NODE_48685_length_379_cov_0.550000_1_plen_39_part_01
MVVIAVVVAPVLLVLPVAHAAQSAAAVVKMPTKPMPWDG